MNVQMKNINMEKIPKLPLILFFNINKNNFLGQIVLCLWSDLCIVEYLGAATRCQ